MRATAGSGYCRKSRSRRCGRQPISSVQPTETLSISRCSPASAFREIGDSAGMRSISTSGRSSYQAREPRTACRTSSLCLIQPSPLSRPRRRSKATRTLCSRSRVRGKLNGFSKMRRRLTEAGRRTWRGADHRTIHDIRRTMTTRMAEDEDRAAHHRQNPKSFQRRHSRRCSRLQQIRIAGRAAAPHWRRGWYLGGLVNSAPSGM